jgi:outer membrane protein assembly factor BamB
MLPLGAGDPRVIGEFRLHFQLGAGGMGRVYLASSPGGRAVAVKVIHARLARDPAFLSRFRREVAAAQAVNGAYAAPVIAAGPDDDPPWLATAYVAGPSLADAVAETGPLPTDAVLRLAAGLAEALRAIHGAGLVHRDLKPANVLLADDGPRVIDFGIARAQEGTVLTSPGSVLGTPAFMSPEQAQGQPTGPASDIFSLGSVVYFAATGAVPFGSETPAIMIYQIVHTEPDLDRLPPGVRDLAAACLAKDPAVRPAPAELAASLTGAPPAGDSRPAFWPAPVARLIAGHQARFAAGLMAGERPPAEGVTVPAAPASPPLASPPPAARPGAPQPAPGMGRRRALAALAGMATAGLVVAGWELTRPGPAAADNLAAQRRISSARPGTQLWSFQTNGAVGSIKVAGGIVYAGTVQRAIYALDALTGRLLWRHLMSVGKTFYLAEADGLVVAANGYNETPAAGYDGGVYALDAGTGKLRWLTVAPIAVGLAAAGDAVYAAAAFKSNTTGGVTALSAGTGEILWTYDNVTKVDIDGGMAVAGGLVYVVTGHGEIYALNAQTGDVRWRVANPAITFTTGLLVVDGVVYTCSRHEKQGNANPVLHALQARTGHELWQHPFGASPYSAAYDVGAGLVVAAVDRDLISSKAGVAELLALNAATGQQLWSVPVTGAIYWVAAGPGNAVYTITADGALDAWQADTGNHLWSQRGAAAPSTGIALDGGVAYFGSNDNHVYAVAARPS